MRTCMSMSMNKLAPSEKVNSGKNWVLTYYDMRPYCSAMDSFTSPLGILKIFMSNYDMYWTF